MVITFCICPVPSSSTAETSPHTNTLLLLLPVSLEIAHFHLTNLPPCFCAHNLVQTVPICPSPPKTRLKSVKKETEANDYLLCSWHHCPLWEQMHPYIHSWTTKVSQGSETGIYGQVLYEPKTPINHRNGCRLSVQYSNLNWWHPPFWDPLFHKEY